MMLAKDAIGKNIRSLRIAFGETQDQLGLAIRTSKNNVSNYGKGRTTIPAKKLAAIADHYMLSYEELTQCDFSDLQKLIVDETSFAKHLHIVFPIVVSDRSLSNDTFRKACQAHQKLYANIRDGKWEDLDNGFNDLFDYLEEYEDEQIATEAAANFISFWLLWSMFINTAVMLHEK